MKTYNDYKNYLEGRGYTADFIECYDEDEGRFNSSFIKNGKSVILDSQGEDGESSIVTSAKIELSFISNPEDYDCDFSDETTGVTLNFYDRNNSLEKFRYCVGLQINGILKHEIFILEKHLENLTWLHINFDPVCEMYDFRHTGNNIFVNGQDWTGLEGYLITEYTHPSEIYSLCVKTHILTGELSIEGLKYEDLKAMDQNEIKLYFIREVLCDQRTLDIKPEFEYLFSNDPKETIGSYREVSEMYNRIRYKKDLTSINVDIIPERYMSDYNNYKNEIL